MEFFIKLFGSLLALVCHCFDRMVILGHIPLLTRPENIVHFFRDVHQSGAITKEVLRRRTDDYNYWVDAFARNHKIPAEWAEKGVRKEDYVRPYAQRMERRNRFGVYFILKSMEVGRSFRSSAPRFPVEDPDYRIISRQRCRYTHYYFYRRPRRTYRWARITPAHHPTWRLPDRVVRRAATNGRLGCSVVPSARLR